MAESKKKGDPDEDPFDPFHLNSKPPGEDSPDRPVAISVSSQRRDDKSKSVAASGPPPPHPDDEDDGGSNMSPSPPPQVSRITRSPPTLPPKLVVKLAVQEEVSSVAVSTEEGSSQVSVEGSVYAQLQCSDATQNAPFCLVVKKINDDQQPSTPMDFRPNPIFTTVSPIPTPADPTNATKEEQSSFVVKIPKPEIGRVLIAQYTVTEHVRHMPILLERKVTITDERKCRVALQVRSKLTNAADMEQFSLVVAVPEVVNAETLEILKGDGVYDPLKRTLHWKLASLEKGQSFMVSAQGQLWELPSIGAGEPHFPVLLQCTSSGDAISRSVDFDATAAPGHQASVTGSTTSSFRLLHRLT